MDGQGDQADYVRIGRSGVAMWMRIVSSWICKSSRGQCVCLAESLHRPGAVHVEPDSQSLYHSS